MSPSIDRRFFIKTAIASTATAGCLLSGPPVDVSGSFASRCPRARATDEAAAAT